jgi:prepilin-type N-terminal cleavage/methylation domain-containing protein
VTRTRHDGGFTLTELMVVVALIAVLSTLAWGSLRPDPRPADVAATSANLIREAARKATAGGAVRADVVVALGNNEQARARSRIRIYTAAGVQYVVAERLAERAVGSSPVADWFETMRQRVPKNNTLTGWRSSADLNGGVGPLVTLTGSEVVEIRCYPDGRCDGATLYFSDTRSTRRSRTVMMPLGGSPAVFETW